MRDLSFILLILAASLALGCSGSEFAGASGGSATAKKDKSKQSDEDEADDDSNEDDGDVEVGGEGSDDDLDIDSEDGSGKADADINALDEETITTADGVVSVGKCSQDYTVGGQSNIYLAGTPAGTSISYKKGAPDRAPAQDPLLVVPNVNKCIRAGAKLYFQVSGQISHGAGSATNADGRLDAIYNHERGAIFGKSDIRAPLNAFVGLFLSDGDPSSLPAPGTLSFATQSERDYKVLSPKVGQVFFIGDGKTSAGEYQKITVPDGAKRLYFGIMDVYEWNNNSGSLTGAILIEK